MIEITNYINEYVSTVLNSLNVRPTVQVEYDEEDEVFYVDLRGDRLSFLIGHRGDSLEGFQHLLALSVYSKFGEWQHITLDINNYRDRQKERLEDIAKSYIDRVRFFSKEVSLPPMSPFDRKQVHEFLSGYGDVESFSVGEGPERHIVLKPADRQ